MALLFGAAKWYNYGVMRTIAIFVCLLVGIVAAEPCFNVERDIYRMVGNDGANEWASDAETPPPQVQWKRCKPLLAASPDLRFRLYADAFASVGVLFF